MISDLQFHEQFSEEILFRISFERFDDYRHALRRLIYAAKALYDRGYSYVIFDSDVTTLRAVAYSHVDEFKELMKK